MLAFVSWLKFQFFTLPSTFLMHCYKTIRFSPRLCKVAKCFSIVENILQLLQGLVFAQPTNWGSSWFRPIFVGCRIGTLHLLLRQELPLLLSVFHAFTVSLNKTSICSFGSHCFVLCYVTFNISKMSDNFLSNSACSLFSLFIGNLVISCFLMRNRKITAWSSRFVQAWFFT